MEELKLCSFNGDLAPPLWGGVYRGGRVHRPDPIEVGPPGQIRILQQGYFFLKKKNLKKLKSISILERIERDPYHPPPTHDLVMT